ncbi:ATP-binding protein [Lactococcus allomyrinae]|uniref:ATP-binding protein n=1 Tax=Lactococcus allomyrinae TaxID=2419773 RepID=A0A387BHB1_9LACT|nr:ATP-binding protein [Lactococcus allomyrinae]AYG02038.1 ATP-binding protein [Lactococcus allomyrinae]
MKNYNFIEEASQKDEKKKHPFDFLKVLKNKEEKSEPRPQDKKQALDKEKSDNRPLSKIKQDFGKYFNLKKNTLLTYPIDRPIDSAGRLHATIDGKEEYSYLLAVKGYDLAGQSEEEYGAIKVKYWSFHKNFTYPFKEIYMNFPENNSKNQAYLLTKFSGKAGIQRLNEIKDNYLKEEIRKLKVVEEEFKSKRSFIAIYGQTEEELDDRLRQVQGAGGKLLGLQKLEQEEVEILFELLNRGELQKKTEAENFIEKTAPSDICFDYANHIPVNGYEEAIVVVTALSTNVNNGWLQNFTHHVDVDATTVDYRMKEEVNYAKMMSDSIEVSKKKYKKARNDTNKDRAQQQYNILRQKAFDMDNDGEVIKEITIRMLVSAPDLKTLNDKVDTIAKNTSGKGTQVQVYNNMGFYDWSSRFVSSDFQSKMSISREGVERSALALALGFAHNQTYLSDPTGQYFGRTKTQCSVYLDIFTKTADRLSYDIFISGMKGSGKSTFLKKLTISNFIVGNFVYVFDKAREFKELTRWLGGDYLPLDGTRGLVNMLQVLPLLSLGGDESDDVTKDIWGSYNLHISKTINRFKNWIDFTKDEVLDVNSILDDFYQDFFVLGKGYQWKQFDITGLANQDYPTFDDFYRYLVSGKVKDVDPQTTQRLIKMTKNVITRKRSTFVGHTTMDNILTSRFITFDISNITTETTGDADILFDVTLSLLFSMAQNRGRKEKHRYETGQISFEEIVRSLIVVDECHNVLNPYKLQATEMFLEALRENRKFYYGVALATQLIETMIPDNAAQMSGNPGLAVQNLKAIIGLCQYKAWMRQSNTSIQTIKNNFSGYFKESDYHALQHFKVDKNIGSELILSGTGERGLEMYHYATPHELSLFQGGA